MRNTNKKLVFYFISMTKYHSFTPPPQLRRAGVGLSPFVANIAFQFGTFSPFGANVTFKFGTLANGLANVTFLFGQFAKSLAKAVCLFGV